MNKATIDALINFINALEERMPGIDQEAKMLRKALREEIYTGISEEEHNKLINEVYGDHGQG